MSDDLIKKLAKLHEEHPELPVITMVDTEVVPSDEFSYWLSKIRAVSIKKYIVTDSEVIFYEDMDYDNVWNIYDYSYVRDKMSEDISEEEADKVLAELYEKAPWIEAIIVWVGVNNEN
jgi:hypothetical protein